MSTSIDSAMTSSMKESWQDSWLLSVGVTPSKGSSGSWDKSKERSARSRGGNSLGGCLEGGGGGGGGAEALWNIAGIDTLEVWCRL